MKTNPPIEHVIEALRNGKVIADTFNGSSLQMYQYKNGTFELWTGLLNQSNTIGPDYSIEGRRTLNIPIESFIKVYITDPWTNRCEFYRDRRWVIVEDLIKLLNLSTLS